MDKTSGKNLISTFFRCFTDSDIEGVLDLLTDNVSWRMMGQHGGMPVSGTMDKEGVINLMRSVRELVEGHLVMTPKEWTVEMPRIAAEVGSNAKLKNGRVYNNLYHYLFILKGDKIETIREYGDTDQVRRVFLDP